MITGRVHPGETNSSCIVHGLIKFLVGKDKVAKELRKRIIFKIIPMINADGVIVGNTRCSMIGRDVNRLFSKPVYQAYQHFFNAHTVFRASNESGAVNSVCSVKKPPRE